MASVAKISGVALRPGVSRNRRLYSAELIGKAAKRMQERLADPAGLPIVMRTHHDAGDDTSKIVGRVTEVSVDNDQALRYKAELIGTAVGSDMASLVTGRNAPLRSVSIHGYWLGEPRQVKTQEGMADTADDLEIDAIDFTAFPGVTTAVIDRPGGGVAKESATGAVRTPISEAMEADVVIVDEDTGWADISENAEELYTVNPESSGPGSTEGLEPVKWSTRRGRQYELDAVDERWWVQEAKYSADDMKDLLAKGHAMKNDSGEPSYPIADVADLKKAIKAVGRGNADHDAIRKHIMKRAKALGATSMIPDNWNSDGSMKESAPRLGEITEFFGDGGEASGFCIDAWSGPLSVSVRGCVSPDQLRAAAAAAASAAMDAISAMDPDADADIDVGDMGEYGAVSPDDDMTDQYGESRVAKTGTVNVEIKSTLVTDEQIRDYISKEFAKLQERLSPGAAVEEMVMPPDDHDHTHDGTEPHTHSHVHIHESEGDGPQYSHGHTHAHVHSPADGPAHEHGHNHIHVTSPAATAETTEGANNQMEESAMGDTQEKAAEAAPTRTLTEADMKALGDTIGGALAEALRAIAEQKEAKHAATTQETTESVAETAAAESVQADTTPKAVDVDALKESLARELRKELRDELRSEFLKENGLPPRRGYRVNESSEEEVELTDADVFNNHRVNILLGDYGMPPKADAPAA